VVGVHETRGYGDRMRTDPDRESRWPAVAVWTISGVLAGLALTVIAGSFPVPMLIGTALGLAWGLFSTRKKFVPDED
jgi:hypothetical protein